ncbi:MAG: methyltransferase domain-containing protein [Pyrinomonadaceae bacterium]
MKSLNESLPRTGANSGQGIVIDIGTGDGRFVSAMAKASPNKFFIGIDANVKPLEKPSMKATRKLNKGGLPNVMFVQAAVEVLPEEFTGVADEIHIHFQWGSLLRAVVLGERKILGSLRRIAAQSCLLEIIIGIDPERDESEYARLELPVLNLEHFRKIADSRYDTVGFRTVEIRELSFKEWRKIETTWARKLSSSSNRSVIQLVFQAK